MFVHVCSILNKLILNKWILKIDFLRILRQQYAILKSAILVMSSERSEVENSISTPGFSLDRYNPGLISNIYHDYATSMSFEKLIADNSDLSIEEIKHLIYRKHGSTEPYNGQLMVHEFTAWYNRMKIDEIIFFAVNRVIMAESKCSDCVYKEGTAKYFAHDMCYRGQGWSEEFRKKNEPFRPSNEELNRVNPYRLPKRYPDSPAPKNTDSPLSAEAEEIFLRTLMTEAKELNRRREKRYDGYSSISDQFIHEKSRDRALEAVGYVKEKDEFPDFDPTVVKTAASTAPSSPFLSDDEEIRVLEKHLRKCAKNPDGGLESMMQFTSLLELLWTTDRLTPERASPELRTMAAMVLLIMERLPERALAGAFDLMAAHQRPPRESAAAAPTVNPAAGLRSMTEVVMATSRANDSDLNDVLAFERSLGSSVSSSGSSAASSGCKKSVLLERFSKK